MDIPPVEIVQKTPKNKTHLYLIIEKGNGQDPRKHYMYILPVLRYPIQRQKVSYNKFLLQLNNHVAIISHNYSWELHQTG